MNAPARDLTSGAIELSEALEGGQDEMRAALASALSSLRGLPDFDFSELFDRTVREHRETVAAFDRLLCSLNGAGHSFLRCAVDHPDLHKELDGLLPRAQKHIRIGRALAATLAGDPSAKDETPAVVAEVARLLAARSAQTAHRWTQEERDAFKNRETADPAKLEAWLES